MRRFVPSLFLAASLAALPWLVSDFLLSLALTCLMFVALASSWAMFSGATNYLSLATSAFFGIGAYVTAWGLETLPYAVLVPLGGLAAAAFAALVGAAVLHLRGAYFAVLTFGLGELVRHAITYSEKTYARTVGRVIMDAPESVTVYLTVLVLACVTAAAGAAALFGLAGSATWILLAFASHRLRSFSEMSAAAVYRASAALKLPSGWSPGSSNDCPLQNKRRTQSFSLL